MLTQAKIDELVTAAQTAQANAYAPYSHFPVGAAVLSSSGTIFSGCNVENAAYGLCNCAERTAIFTAVSAGERQLEALAVTANTPQPVAPCGACRQVMAEFGIKQVILCGAAGTRKIVTLEELLPYAFDKSDVTGDDE